MAMRSCVAKIKQDYQMNNHPATALPRIGVVHRGAGYYTFNLPHVFHTGACETANAFALRALLDCLIDIDVGYLKCHSNIPGLINSGVIYDRTQIWDSIPALYARGYGDCKSLSAALIAQYRTKGEQALPVFRFVKNKRGTSDFHILVQTPTGFKDPSKTHGMGKNENSYFSK
jgi:hypothetical protein